MAPDIWSMGCTLARVEVALVMSMTRAASGYARATMRYGRSVGRQAVGSSDTFRLDQLGQDPSSLDGYCAYLRELAGVARVSAMTFVEVLERSRVATDGPTPGEAEARHLRERARRTGRPIQRGAAAKHFLLY